MRKGKMSVLVGAQAGSEAKGKVSAYLAERYKPEILVMSSSPNAGHTCVMGTEKFVTHQLPVAIVALPNAQIYLGPTSVINEEILLKEIKEFSIDEKQLLIDPRAAVITQNCIDQETAMLANGKSTGQGVGATRCNKMMRSINSLLAWECEDLKPYLAPAPISQLLYKSLTFGMTALYEATQGFDLCLEHGIDPRFCTSKIISPAAALAEFGLPTRMLGSVYGVIRPYPIRIANQAGSSGPYAEAKEITWKEIQDRAGYPVGMDITEYTTTTKRIRRVFEFSHDRFAQFIRICNPNHLCLNFVNYIEYSNLGVTDWNEIGGLTKHWIQSIESSHHCAIDLIGTGPDQTEMINRGDLFLGGGKRE